MQRMRRIIICLAAMLCIVYSYFSVSAQSPVVVGNTDEGVVNTEIVFEKNITDKDIIVALYGNDRLLDSYILHDASVTGSRLFAKVGSLDEADTLKAFAFSSAEKLIPYCEPVSTVIKERTYMPFEDSFLHIDVPNFGYAFDSGKFSLPGGWVSYNTDLGNVADGKQVCIISDNSENEYKALYKDFDAIDSGRILLEISCMASSADDGIYIGFSDGDGETVCSVRTDFGHFALEGTEKISTSAYVDENLLNEYVILIDVDLDKNTISACINGVYTDSVKIPDNSTLSRLTLGSTVGGTGYLLPLDVRMYQNYAVAERFLIPDNMCDKAPYSMNVFGNIKVSEFDNVYQKDTYSALINAKTGENSFAERSFDAVSGCGIFESYVLLPTGSNGAYFAITSENKDVVRIESKDGAWYVGGKKMRDFTTNVWQVLRIETDAVNQKAVIKICGKTVGEVDISADFIDGLEIGICPDTDSVMWFDDITVYNYIEHDDYPSEPIANNDDGYNIGINVCNLWHDTLSGEGWQAVSPFAELEPWLGYYDEGSPELADWEIKIMAEHGIDFQNFCWYSPQYLVTNPIKINKKVGPAIHDGYFNAKYSDKVKFCIFWDNTVSPKNSVSNFKNYIWNYWKEYYFSDPRYMTLDNKPIFTVWSYSQFCNMFGGADVAAEVLEFMREDIKTLGYDGLVFLTRTELAEEIGADGKFLYHFSREGGSDEYQIESLKTEKKLQMHVVPTLAMGHNDIGRNNVRSPLISLSGHKQVAEYIKNDYLGSMNTGTWKDNTLFVSTWNEFSEGHYICPSGEFGYGYLETIKDVFTNDENDHSEIDVMPTQAQKERITKIYPDNYQPIRYLKTTDPLAGEKYNVIASWDFSDKNDVSEWSFSNLLNLGTSESGTVFQGIDNDVQLYIKKQIDISSKPIIHIRMKTPERIYANKDYFISPYIYIFFTTESSPTLEGSVKIVRRELSKDGKTTDYYIDMSQNREWTGTLKQIRFDPVENTLPFEIELFELLAPINSDESDIKTWDFSNETFVRTLRTNNIEFVDFSQNCTKAHGTTNDPQIYFDNLNISLSSKPVINIRMRTSKDTKLEIFYTTDVDKAVEGRIKHKQISVMSSQDFVDYHIDLSGQEQWDSTLTMLRLDPVENTEAFEIEYIKLVTPGNKPIDVYVNENRMKFDFKVYYDGNDVSVTVNPDMGFFTLLNLHHTWNRYTGVLYVENDNHSLELTIGSDRATLDGKTVYLGYLPELRDGLPVVKLKNFCDMLGFSTEIEDGVIRINTGKTPIKLDKVSYLGWEFDTNGNNENWYSYDSVLYAYDGLLNIKNSDYSDMHMFMKNTEIDASMYTKLVVGVRMKPEDARGQMFQLFFRTDSQSFSEDKSFKHMYDADVMTENETYEFTVDLDGNSNWKGIVDNIRVDVWNNDADCAIDHIRFLP